MRPRSDPGRFIIPLLWIVYPFERAFGMKATPMGDAIRETVDWYRAHPDLAEA
jgi:hypothetical protein